MRTIIKPGLLVALKSTVSGGVHYQRADLPAHPNQDGAVKKWETTRTIVDPDEVERANKARNRALQFVRTVCSQTAFGMICPRDRQADLDGALAKARECVEAHNATAKHTRVNMWALIAQVVDSDAAAAAAVAQDVCDALTTLHDAIKAKDVKRARAQRDAVRDMLQILSDGTCEVIRQALDGVTAWGKARGEYDRRGHLEGAPEPSEGGALDLIIQAQADLWAEEVAPNQDVISQQAAE